MFPQASDIEYFIEAASSGNLSRAAERLGISQPSLTIAIKRLESLLAVQLFVRSHRGVTLTPAGKLLRSQAQCLHDQWEKVRHAATKSVSEVSGHYRLGCHTSIGAYILPKVLTAIYRTYPQLNLTLVHDLSRNVTEQVISHEIDLGLVVNPVPHPDLVIQYLGNDRISLWYGGKITPLTDPKSGTATIICDINLSQSQTILKKLATSGIRYARLLPTSSLEVVTALTRAGLGIGILPTHLAASHGTKPLKHITAAPSSEDRIATIYRVENRGITAIKYLASAMHGFIS